MQNLKIYTVFWIGVVLCAPAFARVSLPPHCGNPLNSSSIVKSMKERGAALAWRCSSPHFPEKFLIFTHPRAYVSGSGAPYPGEFFVVENAAGESFPLEVFNHPIKDVGEDRYGLATGDPHGHLELIIEPLHGKTWEAPFKGSLSASLSWGAGPTTEYKNLKLICEPML